MSDIGTVRRMDPLVAQVRRQVAEHEPGDAAERGSVARFLDLFDDLDAPLDEHADPVHVTGSAFVVGVRGIVLLRHRRLGRWLQPGGHVDAGESPWAAAIREAREETGLDVGPIDVDADGVPRLAHVDVHPGGRGHTHLDLRYVLGGDDGDPAPPPGESQEVGWFERDAAMERAGDERLAGAIARLRW